MLPKVGGGNGTTKDDILRDPKRIGRRIRGWRQPALDVIPETTAWYTTTAPVSDYDAGYNGEGFSSAADYLNQQEAMGGTGVLTNARLKVLDIDDTYARTQGLMFLDKLQALPTNVRENVLAFMQGQRTIENLQGADPATLALETQQTQAAIESLGLAGQIDPTGGELNITQESAGEGLYIALALAFPELNLDLEDPKANFGAIEASTAVSDYYLQRAVESEGVNKMADALVKVQTGEAQGLGGYYDVFKDVTLGFAGGAAEVGFGALGGGVRAIGAEGIVDDAASAWHTVENEMSRYAVGYQDEEGEWRKGLLTWDLDPKDPDFENKVEDRMLLLTLVGAPVGSGLLSKTARRFKLARSVVGTVDDVGDVLGINRAELYPRQGGPLGVGLEAARTPARFVTRKIDEAILGSRWIRQGPEDWFIGRINGRPGRTLLNVLDGAKEAHPDDIGGQLGFVRQVYGSTIPDGLVTDMLNAGSRPDAIGRFVNYVSDPTQRPFAIREMDGRITAIQRRIDAIHRKYDDEPSSVRRELDILHQRGEERSEDFLAFSREGDTGTSLRAVNEEIRMERLRQRYKRLTGENYEYRGGQPRPEVLEDGQLLNIPASEAARYVEFPGRLEGTGRTPEQLAELEKSLEGGYNPDFVPEQTLSGEPEGHLTMEFDPATGRAVIREGHHRIGILARAGKDIEVRVKHVDEIHPARGSDIEEVEAGAALEALSELGAEGAPPAPEVGRIYTRAETRDPGNQLADLRELTALRLERAGLEWSKSETPGSMPLLRYPKKNFFRAIVRQPTTSVERLAARMLRFGQLGEGQVFDLAKLVDDMPTRPKLFVPGHAKNPADWRDQNFDLLTNYLRRAGVEGPVAQKILGDLAEVTNVQDFYEIIEHQIFGKDGVINKALPEGTPDDLRKQIIYLHDSTLEGRTFSTLTQRNERDGVVDLSEQHIMGRRSSYGETTPLPSRPSEYLGYLNMPDVERLIEATSVVRKLNHRLSQGKFGQANISQAWRAPLFVSHLATLVLKPTVMLTRLVAMGTRIQMEQALRMQGFGYKPWKTFPDGMYLMPGGIPVPWGEKGNRILSGAFGEDGWKLIGEDPFTRGPRRDFEASDVGMFLEEVTEATQSRQRTVESTLELRTGRRRINKRHTEAYRAELEQAHSDLVDRNFARLDLDRERFKEWLLNDEDGIEFMNMHRQTLEQASFFDGDMDTAINEWLDRRIDYLRQVSGGDPDYLRYIATGHLKLGGERINQNYARLFNGDRQVERYAVLREEIDSLNDEITERVTAAHMVGTADERAELAALMRQRFEARKKLSQMEDVNPEMLDPGSITASHKREFRREVQRRWEEAPDTIPPRLLVTHRLDRAADDLGLIGDAQHYAGAISNMFYRGFKPLSYVDSHGTRGSLFTQSNTRFYNELKARGYSDVQARAIAHAKAGATTRDMMYDLSARSSTQRALKDVFWFAPATQEVLYTWLVKIPSQSYWPIGAAATATKLYAMVELLEAAGVIETDADGAKIIKVPGLSRFVEFASGGRIKVPDTVYGKLAGLNLVTTNLGLPGLSTQGNWALGAAAKKWGGPFKALSDVLQPYGPEANLFPTPVIYAWEVAFGEPPPWMALSGDVQKAQYDRSFDQGIQYAWHDMADRGIKPPRPEDYGTYNTEEKRWVLSPKQEDAYRADQSAYVTQLMQESERYTRGIAAAKLAGATVFPMALYTTSDEAQMWRKFWNTVVAPDGFGSAGLTANQHELITQFLEEHPNSLAFSVYSTGYGEKKRDLPFGESLDDAYFDDFYTGERRVLSPEEYSNKLMATESRRFYAAQVSETMKKISPEMDPWELLTNGAARNDALSQYRESWERYLHLNPDIDTLLKEQQALYVEQNNVPIQSFEAERLSDTIDLLKQVGPMLTGESDYRPDELRYVQAKLAALYSDEGEFGKPNTKAEKATAWWFESVFDPYIEASGKIYEQIEYNEARGLDVSPLYNQLRDLQNKPSPNYKGQAVPGIEEFFFGNKTSVEQEAAIYTWTSRPPTWLSDFQLEQVGFEITPQDREFLNQASEFDEWFYNEIEERDISPSSDQYDQWLAWREQQFRKVAAEYGSEELAELQFSTPAVRLDTQGFGAQVPEWEYSLSAANSVVESLEQSGLSPAGFSEQALAQKAWFYDGLERARQQNPELDQLFNDLSYSFKLDGGGFAAGVLLYERLFFGNFNDDETARHPELTGYGA